MNWKKKDAVLILTVLLIAGAAFGVHEFAGGDGADIVTVKVDGKVTGTYPLAKDQKIRRYEYTYDKERKSEDDRCRLSGSVVCTSESSFKES